MLTYKGVKYTFVECCFYILTGKKTLAPQPKNDKGRLNPAHAPSKCTRTRAGVPRRTAQSSQASPREPRRASCATRAGEAQPFSVREKTKGESARVRSSASEVFSLESEKKEKMINFLYLPPLLFSSYLAIHRTSARRVWICSVCRAPPHHDCSAF